MKRLDYISWDEYFMGVAVLTSMRSKDPSTQTGACIVKNNRILGAGYNGFPRGCSDDEFPWDKKEGLDGKYLFVVHAEENAVLNSNIRDLEGSSLYTTLFPCNECAKAIIQAGIRTVFYLSENNKGYTESFQASKKMFDAAGIQYKQLSFPEKQLTLSLEAKP